MTGPSGLRVLPERPAVLAALVCVSALSLLGVVGSLLRPDPTRFDRFRNCLTSVKGLSLAEVAERDAIARSGADATHTTIEGNPVTIVNASDTANATRIEHYYEAVGADSPAGRLERRGPLVYLWDRLASPTQRQTVYDCADELEGISPW